MNRMSLMIAIVFTHLCLAGCTTRRPEVNEIAATSRFIVGTKTPFYEVVSTKELKLAPGVQVVPIKGAVSGCGAFEIIAQQKSGGYVSCGCVGAQTSSCTTTNDNPDHFSCAGGCTDSEGNPHGCEGAILPGPPKDPYVVSFRDAFSTKAK